MNYKIKHIFKWYRPCKLPSRVEALNQWVPNFFGDQMTLLQGVLRLLENINIYIMTLNSSKITVIKVTMKIILWLKNCKKVLQALGRLTSTDQDRNIPH